MYRYNDQQTSLKKKKLKYINNDIIIQIRLRSTFQSSIFTFKLITNIVSPDNSHQETLLKFILLYLHEYQLELR